MIRIHNLTHHYGVRPILKDITLEIPTGDLVVLLGPNGMGKSTLLGCLAGVLWPARGYVEIDGVKRRQSADEELALRRRIAYLPDNAWLPVARTGREFILAVGRLYQVDDFRLFDHADRLLKLFNLEEQGDQPISSYSAGQRKKIALCSALITDAPYLFLDEPFSGGLDPAGIMALKRVLQKLATDQRITIVMTTPVPELVEELAERILVLRDGQVAAFSTPDELRHQAHLDGGTLADALARVMHPETQQNIDHYFADEPPTPGGRV